MTGASEGSSPQRRVDDGGPGASVGDPDAVQPDAEYIPHVLLSRLAHDIRSPLGLLSGALDEIQEDLAAQLDPSQKRMFELAERGLGRLRRMADVLSTAAELDSGGLMLDRGEIELARVVSDVVQKLDRVDPRRSVEVEVEIESGVTASLDGVRADEALSELIGQARRGARSKVRISFEDEGESLVLRIEDDGDGWSQQDADNAFNRLYEPKDRRGTGLGLSVARDLVRAHGGDVAIERSSLPASRPGRTGGCFVVRFPA